ncbi:hypothetical protein GQ53DRAFT_807805 [Thozetella sp. PMI_491]|nr:hypothetical protein GQ53DRAFT_807805 [Thozetella sp. PMI_491]
MRWIVSLSLAGLQWCNLVRGWAQLSKGAFEGDLAANDFTLVAFVWPDEEKTKLFGPEWSNAFSQNIEPLIGINCETAVDICNGYGIKSYPEVHLFHKDRSVAIYHGPPRAAAMLSFVGRMRRPVVSHLQSINELIDFKHKDEIVFVAYLDAADGNAAQAFAALAQEYREDFSFGLVADPAVAETQDVKVPAVMCYRVVDGDTVLFPFDEEPGKLEKWTVEASRPVISELTVRNRQQLLDRGWPMVYLFAPTQKERNELRKKLYRFAQSYYDSLTTVLVDPLEFPELMPQLGLEPGVFPAGAVHQLSKDRVYPYPKGAAFDSSALQKWGLDVYQGKIKPWTPPGVTTTYDDLGPTRVASRKISIKSIPGVKIKIAGHDEL